MSQAPDFLASQSNYVDHLLPIWNALMPDERGHFYCPTRLRPYVLARGVAEAGIGRGRSTRRRGAPLSPCVVASAGDLQGAGRRPVILVEHGAGQAYDVDHSSYSGGSGRGTAVAFLCPNEVVASRNRATYPDARSVVIGSPRVESLVQQRDRAERVAPGATSPRPVVALSFHWDCRLTPETRWAFPHYEAVLPQIIERFDVIGHGHPRYGFFFAQLWKRLGVEHVEHFEDVAARASVYVCDNSSTLFEFAAVGRPVVVLNALWYRRGVDLWPRFWAHADVGLNVEEPRELASTIERALCDPLEARTGRLRAVQAVWGEIEGATQRAVDTIRETVASLC